MKTQVIKSINQKSPTTGFNALPINIGAEQRFVGALRNSNVNNLEEQFIIGVDCFTEHYTINNLTRTSKKFYNVNDYKDSEPAEYYQLIYDSEAHTNYAIRNYLFNLTDSDNWNAVNEEETSYTDGNCNIYLGAKATWTGDILDLTNDNQPIFSFENSEVDANGCILLIEPQEFLTTDTYKLYYHVAGLTPSEDILLVEKAYDQNYVEKTVMDGDVETTVTAIQTIETITNHIIE